MTFTIAAGESASEDFSGDTVTVKQTDHAGGEYVCVKYGVSHRSATSVEYSARTSAIALATSASSSSELTFSKWLANRLNTSISASR